jgi:anaerobic magnesium-protoporphyrin IX monomethyl ester cyclase
MDLLLAHAYFLSEDAEERRIMRPYPPLGILYLSAHLKTRGFDVGIFDGTFRSFADFATVLDTNRPPVVGIYVNMMTKRHALRMIAMARAAGAQVVVGGPDPPYYAAEYLDAGADIVVIGEGESTLEELLPAFRDERSRDERLSSIAGIVFRRSDGQLVRTSARALVANLSAQPHPDRDAIDIDRYVRTWRVHHGYGPVSLITARGCPYTCTWCSRSVFGTTHRRRSVEDVANEVEAIVDRYQPDRLWYADDVFAIHRGWTLDYAAELNRRQLRLPFECISRAERIDDAVADALADMRCWRVWIGSESGSQEVLDAMERRVNVEQVQDAAKRLQRRGIQVGLFIMLGFDGERREDLRATIEHLKQTAPNVFLTTVSYPIKGTPYYDRVANRIVARQPWSERTDRDLIIRERPGPKYYNYARRWITGEVAQHEHWQRGRYAQALRAASSALVGRIGMTLTEHLPLERAGISVGNGAQGS